jgi:hypothetical protein
MLIAARHPALDAIYRTKSDNRALAHAQPEQWKEEWAATAQSLHVDAARDAKCHEAVMLWVHHVAEEARPDLLPRLVLPLLPETQRRFDESDLHARGDDAAVGAYVRATTCAICHSSDGAVLPKGAPSWPPPIAPVWPTQFTAPVSGFDNGSTPSNFTGTFYYDWVNNLLRYDSVPNPIKNELGLPPQHNSSRIFIGEPRPSKDPVADLGPGIYQFTWGAKPSCVHFPMVGQSIERPDSMVHVNASHRDRVMMEDGRWTDYWYWWFDDTQTEPLQVHEAFQMWTDINTNWPVKLYGPLQPNFNPSDWGETLWHKLTVGPVDLGAWTGLDYSICNKAEGLTPVRSLHEFAHAGSTIAAVAMQAKLLV